MEHKDGPRAAQKAATREKIMHAAAILFRERGFAATTIRDVATTAGLSTGSVFANFDSKAELYEAVTGRRAPHGALQDAAPDLLTALKALLSNIYEFGNVTDPELFDAAEAAIAKAEAGAGEMTS